VQNLDGDIFFAAGYIDGSEAFFHVLLTFQTRESLVAVPE
jgi:hypothetical protein